MTRLVRGRKAAGFQTVNAAALEVLLLCVLAGLLTGAGFVVAKGNPGIQGRYLFSVIVPIAALLALGWRQWVPTAWRRQGLALAASGLFLFDAVALLLYVVPFFYPLWS